MKDLRMSYGLSAVTSPSFASAQTENSASVSSAASEVAWSPNPSLAMRYPPCGKTSPLGVPSASWWMSILPRFRQNSADCARQFLRENPTS